ncbi:flagellar assembly protein FliH [Paenibacillus ginsengihumi]|uniref:flagellar assembly protein FliH n=1 Tax=Paenibacillus ginsengihumi TaxID=431596 RepID=UPI00035EBDA8|nr:flagellar assembly protein FliH [Paenibacillus ginsengihumi]
MSNVIKYAQYVPVNASKLVKPSHHPVAAAEADGQEQSRPQGPPEEVLEALRMKEQILQDAESFAEEQVRAAMEEAAAMRQRAQEEIEQWWQERREQDRDLVSEAREEGFRQGYQEGKEQAEAELRERYSDMLHNASDILEQSYVMKQQIIQESEPFLIELSCAIAEKIVARQLTIEPDWVIELVRKVLARRREKGVITLCVAPQHFSHIQDARDELLLHIDSQAELAIIPDPTVRDHGCVVRSSFGSIDARIDTQLNEIKNSLQQLAARNEG